MASKKETCNVCGGAGHGEFPTYWCDEKIDWIMKEMDCEACDGTGFIKPNHTLFEPLEGMYFKKDK